MVAVEGVVVSVPPMGAEAEVEVEVDVEDEVLVLPSADRMVAAGLPQPARHRAAAAVATNKAVETLTPP
jgi:hypothetical protein